MDQTQRLAVIVFSDVVGYSKLTEADAKEALETVLRFKKTVTRISEKFDGKVIHFYGDGALCLFDGVGSASSYLLQLQECSQTGDIPVMRHGAHLGEVALIDNSVFGNAVNIAARLQELAQPGQVYVTEAVARQASSLTDYSATYVRTAKLKNIQDPIAIYALAPGNDKVHLAPKHLPLKTLVPAKKTLIPIGILALLIMFLSIYDRVQLRKQEILVVSSFENQTGDSRLDQAQQLLHDELMDRLGNQTNLKILLPFQVPKGLKKSGFPGWQPNKKKDAITLELRGRIITQENGDLLFTSDIRDLRENRSVGTLPDVVVPMAQYGVAVEDISQRVAAYYRNKDHILSSSLPREDAYLALEQALESWKSDYERAFQYLNRAMELDSNFIDPYFYTFDAYYNLNKYSQADSMLKKIESTFPLEDLNTRDLAIFNYEKSLITGNNKSAHNNLKILYLRDSLEPYTNTSFALMTARYVNEPALALNILQQIHWDSFDLDNQHYFRDRATLALRSHLMLGNAEAAVRVAKHFPTDERYHEHSKLKARAFVTNEDTMALFTLLEKIRITKDAKRYSTILYNIAQDYRRLNQLDQFRKYAHLTLENLPSNKTKRYVLLLQDLGRSFESIEFLQKEYSNHLSNLLVRFLLGRGYALAGEQARTIQIIEEMEENRRPFDFGKVSYNQAVLFALLGHSHQALIKLESAIQEGLQFNGVNADQDPDLASLHFLPSFQKLIHPLRS